MVQTLNRGFLNIPFVNVPCGVLYDGEYDVLYTVPGGGGGDNGGDVT